MAMRRKMNRLIYGAAAVFAFFSFSFILAQIFTDERDSDKGKNYMGLDGEIITLPIWCSTCALVGTSGHLLQEEYGSEIDKTHNCVFRLGFAPNRGLERFVGSRTTARIVDSFSFFPFLKRPWKLVTGPFASEAWILFDRRPGDISWFHRPLLSDLIQKYDSKFLWMTKRAEVAVHDFLKAQTSKIRVTRTSALWFAFKVIQDAGCKSLRLYGIPDHQICKRNMNVTVQSLYWDDSSAPLCTNGVDASFTSSQRVSSAAILASVHERKILLQHYPDYLNNIQFLSPEWPS